jgi:hypothetical protein
MLIVEFSLGEAVGRRFIATGELAARSKNLI